MLSRIRTYFLFASSLLVLSCQDEGEDLLPPEERVATAIANLRNDLVAPANGWKLDYRPTEDAGSFLMILKFTQDGLVNIKSDVADEGGRYFDETTPYRIDNALSLELIFETYGVFHYLFEQEQATFGAEFEFAYKMKDGDNLVFESLSDGANPTKITLEPATATDENLFSREIAGNLSFYEGLTPIIFGGFPPSQQIILNDHGISVFWSIDTKKRNISAELASAGTTPNTVVTNGAITLDHSTGYALRNGKVILDEALTFTLSGQSFTISELLLTTFDLTGPTLCSTSADNTNPRYEGQVAGLGSMTMLNSLYSSRGIGFQPNVFTVNVQFVFDGEGNSLSLDGIIQERFPTASGFVFF